MGPKRLQDFAGAWRLARRIDDRRAGAEGRLEGRAVFAPGEGGLICDEVGVLTLPGLAPMEARRRYVWREGGPGRIAVFFDDGRPFHDFALGPGAGAEHVCTPDLYRVRYDFTRWPHWRATWAVTGPRKDYISVSDYAPQKS